MPLAGTSGLIKLPIVPLLCGSATWRGPRIPLMGGASVPNIWRERGMHPEGTRRRPSEPHLPSQKRLELGRYLIGDSIRLIAFY
jgi:hypothetical protein